jgi:hypothetical protein
MPEDAGIVRWWSFPAGMNSQFSRDSLVTWTGRQQAFLPEWVYQT